MSLLSLHMDVGILGDNSLYPASRMVYDWGMDIIEKYLKQATDWALAR